MSKLERYVSTAECAAELGRPARAILRMVERGDLEPAMKLPGRTGAYLFDRADIEALKESRAS